MKRVLAVIWLYAIVLQSSCVLCDTVDSQRETSLLDHMSYLIKTKEENEQNNSIKNQDDTLIRMFVKYAEKIRKESFNDIDSALKESGIKFDRTIPDVNSFGYHHVYDSYGFKLTFGYYPIDFSLDSKDFGNPDKEMLYLVQLENGNISICASDDLHTKDVEYLLS